MEAIIFETAQEDMDSMDPTIRNCFAVHIRKIASMPPRRHLRFGKPHFVEKVTKGARLVYDIKGEYIHIIRCFATHKEYENWYKQL
ncbi:MAG: hypothetical protein WC408_06690 [Candidatus Micrarchaeia archaeon]|jgi:hypothetical protein